MSTRSKSIRTIATPAPSQVIVGVTDPVPTPQASTSPYYASARTAQTKALKSQSRGRTRLQRRQHCTHLLQPVRLDQRHRQGLPATRPRPAARRRRLGPRLRLGRLR
ncbi:hypothetical protein GCM10027030_06550 [Luteococcus sediminum]